MRRTNPALKEDYLRWLESQLKDKYSSPGSYWELVNAMFEKEFVVMVPMDDNRAVDGLDLRAEFAREERLQPETMKFLGAVSFLEVLIGLSRRLAFAAGGQAPGWAWHLLDNLGLQRMSDPLTRYKQRKVEDVMNAVISRTYNSDGVGGFFPLAWNEDDQTQIELWYQMHAYIEELHPEH
jgi:hypothetical protein